MQQILDLNRTMVTLRLSYLSITNTQRRCPTFDSGALFFVRFVSRAHLKNALGSGVQGGTPGALLSPISWRVPRNRHKLKFNCSFTFILCHSTKNEPRKRAKGLAPWNPSAATVLNTAAVDIVSLNETPDRHNSGGRVAEGKRTEHFY